MHCLYHLLSFSMNLTLSSFLPPLNWSVFRRKRKLYIYRVPLALQIFLYGGYSKEVSSDKSSSEKGIVHSDMWSLGPTTWEWNKVHNLHAFLVFRWTYRSVIEWKGKHDFFYGNGHNYKGTTFTSPSVYKKQRMIFQMF